jgi:hypothetical protein
MPYSDEILRLDSAVAHHRQNLELLAADDLRRAKELNDLG